MTTVKLKIKINNSYESEPSSGSGSSISEVIEFEKDQNICTKLNTHLFTITNNASEDKNDSLCNTSSDSKFGSSQESNFKGFTECEMKERTFPISKMGRKPKTKCYKESRQNQDAVKASRNQQTNSSSYDDIMIEQNSCNAVDIQLMNKNYFGNPEIKKKFPDLLSTELSFNGKIKSMTIAPPEIICQKQTTFKPPKLLNPVLEMGESSFLKYSNDRSPDLFEDDETDQGEADSVIYENEERLTEDINKSLNCPTESSFAEENVDGTLDDAANLLRQNIKREKELLKRIKTCLSGIPPPPSLTIPQLDMFSAIANNKEEILNFKTEVEEVASVIVCEEDGLFKPTHPLDEVLEMPWKDTLYVRGHGLSYNLCKASESIELLSLAVIERFIGAETSTSYTSNNSSSPSSAKKRNLRQKMLTQTSGYNRLSHLAKRRAAFSSANLATNLLKPQSCFLGGMQILLDKKKGKSRRKGTTPKRMTPSSKKKAGRKTPSSSARKRLVFRFDPAKPGPSRETSKRALFQSPAKQQRTQAAALKLSLKPEIATRVEKSKRALFSPDKPPQGSINLNEFGSLSQTSQSSLFGGNLDFLSLKRKRTEDDEATHNSKKIFRHENESLTPRSLKIKSQSFCIGAGSTNAISNSKDMLRSNNNNNPSIIPLSKNSSGRPITKAFSDTTFHSSNLLTENHRKKLLWAVSQALQSKQINVAHASFKQFASVLARVVKRIFQEYFLKTNTSTSDTMLRLAKKYVCDVIFGKSADEIYIFAKSKIEEEKKVSSVRLSGYIAPDEFETRKLVLNQSSLCSFENSMDSTFVLSQNSSVSVSQPAHNIKNLDDVLIKSKSAIRLAIQPNASLQKSSSKNNIDGIPLRENLDCEQRWSDQKKFTGVDQQNVSPYSSSKVRSASQTLSFRSSLYDLSTSTAKAKRQISFDTL
ncbi:uncharacterized protein LOC129951321 [Eupeodes corollae]|uniref:uncharacterized protein LOC129951321 n=1 Tax=Eupeodes corollae TaxID=290404 RepID=UPI002492D6B8|nr:uncharacterized protein LOC129951321 [Eupeodes corollae]